MGFNVQHKKGVVILQSENLQSMAIISPKQGGRIVQLVLDNKLVIDEPKNTTYESNYAGAVLFPFANRIADGTYTFKGESYFLVCNEKGRTNAIHGLVYDKEFVADQGISSENEARIELIYNEEKKLVGFPFTFQLKLVYTLTNHGLSLEVEIVNTGEASFPFTLGWHPYFYAAQLEESHLTLEAKYQVIMNEHMITVGSKNHQQPKQIQLKNRFLDDCFSILERKVELVTPTHSLSVVGEYISKFVQFYTPKNEKLVAIEPMTGISNSFNNKKSLLVLRPKEVFTTRWNVALN